MGTCHSAERKAAVVLERILQYIIPRGRQLHGIPELLYHGHIFDFAIPSEKWFLAETASLV